MSSDFECGLAIALKNKRQKVFPDFFAISEGLISAHMATLEGGESAEFSGEPDRHKVTAALYESNIVGSEVVSHSKKKIRFDDATKEAFTEFEILHKPVLDIDLPVWSHESTTPGHFHLIIDKEMTWDQYEKLLNVMEEVGILEAGFVKAAISRGASWIRTPWTEKTKETT